MLFACNTTGKYDAYLDTQIGLSKNEFISSWGATNSMKLSNQQELFSYERQYGDKSYEQESEKTGLITTSVETIEDVLIQRCTTNFLIDNGKIVKWGHSGNNCVLEDAIVVEELKKNIGLNKEKLVSKWGKPKFSIKLDTTTDVLTYYYSRSTFTQSIQECFTNFTLKNGKVAKIAQRGNGCKSANKNIYIKR